MSDAVILTQALSNSYGSVEAVRALNLTVGRSRITAFLGRNGAGKTTTKGAPSFCRFFFCPFLLHTTSISAPLPLVLVLLAVAFGVAFAVGVGF